MRNEGLFRGMGRRGETERRGGKRVRSRERGGKRAGEGERGEKRERRGGGGEGEKASTAKTLNEQIHPIERIRTAF